MQHNLLRFRIIFIVLISLSVGLYSCTTTERATDHPRGTTAADSAGFSEETGLNLAAYRNTLGDSYTTRQHDMPKQLLQASGDAQFGNRNPFEGYRIQLISTPNQSMSDSVAKSFRIWADTTLAGYTPEIHSFFKPPNYRVHVGDFNSRQRAISVSRLVKRQFPNAWVVHDRINPNLVPPDTVQIRLEPLTERKQNN